MPHKWWIFRHIPGFDGGFFALETHFVLAWRNG
jgi:hypothetical protein